MLVALVVATLAVGTAFAQEGGTVGEKPTFGSSADRKEAVPGEIIVKFEEDATRAEEADVRREEGLEKKKELELIDAELVKVEGQPVGETIRELESLPDVEYAEPNLVRYPSGYADEPRFRDLWGLNNTGQTVGGSAGAADVDINGLEASRVTQGNSDLVIAVIDDGVDFSHPDLAGRKWVNPGESGGGKETNRVDDDGNGYVDDVNGWDFCNNDNTVHNSASDDHGTHVAGTIAASVNGQGVTGVAPNVKIMALNFLGCDNSPGTVAKEVKALEYAEKMGARISNASFGAPGSVQSEKDAIEASGQLFVAAAGNGGADGVGDDNDTSADRDYPAAYNSPNILAVAAIDNRGRLASFSNYGATSVDISAPGVSVLSSVPGPGYAFFSGTSMATPHAAGTAGLVASVNPALLNDPVALKKVLMDSGKPLSATAGKTVTGDMIDANAAVAAAGGTTPPTSDTTPPTVGSHSPASGATRVRIASNVTATFSEEMDPATLTDATVTLTDTRTGSTVPSAVRCDSPCRTVTLDPSASLAKKTRYEVRITTGAEDKVGNALAADATWSFTTGRK